MSALNEEWTAEVVGRMHRCRIQIAELARECGYSQPYLSTVLNGGKKLGKGKENTKSRIFGGLERLEARILAEEAESDDTGGTDTGE